MRSASLPKWGEGEGKLGEIIFASNLINNRVDTTRAIVHLQTVKTAVINWNYQMDRS